MTDGCRYPDREFRVERRATVAKVAPAAVRRMADLGGDLRHLVACICPSAGPCCHEVGEETRRMAIQRIGPDAASFFRLSDRRSG